MKEDACSDAVGCAAWRRADSVVENLSRADRKLSMVRMIMSWAVGPCIVKACGNQATVSVTRTTLVVVDHTRYER